MVAHLTPDDWTSKGKISLGYSLSISRGLTNWLLTVAFTVTGLYLILRVGSLKVQESVVKMGMLSINSHRAASTELRRGMFLGGSLAIGTQ